MQVCLLLVILHPFFTQIVLNRSFTFLDGFLNWCKEMPFSLLILIHSGMTVALVPDQAVWPNTSWHDSWLPGIVMWNSNSKTSLISTSDFSNPTLPCMDAMLKTWLSLNSFIFVKISFFKSYKYLKKYTLNGRLFSWFFKTTYLLWVKEKVERY